METEQISYQGKVLALIIYKNEIKEGVKFFTPDDNTLQVGKHSYNEGKVIKPHLHQPVKVEREDSFQEVLYIEKGKVQVTFYSPEGKEAGVKTIGPGDILLVIQGGHGYKFLEPTNMVEVKQGPYMPESRKAIEIDNRK